MSDWRGALALSTGVALAVVGCKATTSRPSFVPFPQSAHGELGFGNPDPVYTITRVTRTVADALAADSIPVARVSERDGYIESLWFDAATLAPTDARPVGPDVVRVRAWVGPAKPGFSEVEVETVFRPVADPSRPERDLETHVGISHPVGQRVSRLLRKLIELYGEPDTTAVKPTEAPPPVDPSAVPVPTDTTARPRVDTTARPPADTTARPPVDTTAKPPVDTTAGLPADTTRARWLRRRAF